MPLTYAEVHLRYTMPAVGALALAAWPFIDRAELFKLALLSALALAYAAPWDNAIVYHGAWTYPPDRVLAVVGLVPVEEYAFFVLQTALTALWTLLCLRWTEPCARFNHDARSHRLVRWTPIACLAAVAAAGLAMAVPAGRRTFYLGATLAWAAPVLAFSWYGAGNYVARRPWPACAAVVAPTLFLCRVDQLAIRERVWRVHPRTSLGVHVADHLPLEEALFFLVSNAVVVLGVAAFDKARAVLDAHAALFCDGRRARAGWPFVRQMFRAFVAAESALPAQVSRDVARCTRVLRDASKSFTAASFLFPSGIRLDLTVLYAFCRVTDDMIDEEQDIEKKKQKLKVIETFIEELFSDRKSDYEVKKNPRELNIDWEKYKPDLTDTELSCFRAISRIAFYLPRKPFHELIAGYQWDIDGRLVRNDDDLLLYSRYVAGSVGVLCVFVMMYQCDDDQYDLLENYDYVIEKALQMGQVLQLVNIARDIVTDSETLGRCYVPTEYMDDVEEELRILCVEKNPRSLGNKKLKKYSSRMIQLANKFQSESVNAILCLPREARRPVLAATEIYHGITSGIQSSPVYPTRASLSKFHKIFIGLHCLYFKNISK